MPSPRSLRLPLGFLTAALTVELLDELVDGVTGAAWPPIRQDLALSYVQVGLLLSLPAVLANVIEPALGLLADRGYRRPIILGGGVCFAAALALFALSGSFWPLLAALLLFSPASGAFVALTQAALMDADPARHEQNMARWVLAGSLGNVAGPLLVSLALTLTVGWRPVYLLLAALTVLPLVLTWRSPALAARPQVGVPEGALFRGLWVALRRGEVRLALLLLEGANLLGDVFRGFLALSFVDTLGASPALAGLAVAVFTGVGLLGDALVVPVLERVPGVRLLRAGALACAVLFPAFLLAPHPGVKLVLLAALGLLTSGWYAVLQARLYTSLPGRSGTVMALGSVAGLLGAALPLLIGLAAERFGLEAALWLLLAGPLALIVGLRSGSGEQEGRAA